MVKKFILSEKEKSRISNMHTQKILLERGFKNLNQSITEQVNYYKDAQGKIVKLEGPMSAPLGTEPATEQEYLAQNPTITVTPPQGQPTQPKTPRYSTVACTGAKCNPTIIKGQARMNDECPSKTLNDSLKPFYPSKYITGSEPNLKILEDGRSGKITTAAWTACKGNLTPTKVAGGGGTTTQGSTTTQGTTVVQGPKIGEPLTANDIATLTAQQ